MKKKAERALIISTVICLLPIILGLVVYGKLPEQVAIHFDNAGKADNYVPKALAAFGLPAAFAVLNLILHVRLNTDPKIENASSTLKLLLKWVLPFTSVIMMPVTLFMAMGVEIPITLLVTAIVGVVFVICGNYLPKCRRNYTMGIRLPWTLSNEDNWNKTHRLAGFVWVVGGLAFVANAFVGLWYLMPVIILLLVVIPSVYSYLLYKKQRKEGAQ